MATTRNWIGRWINNGKSVGIPNPGEICSAPYLRKTFQCDSKPEQAVVYLCAIGYHQLYVNGQLADDRVLAPVVTQYDKRVSYIEYDVTPLLRPGKNALAVLLGNGWYNCNTVEVWNFINAPWRDSPKLRCDLVADGKLLMKSDTTWRLHDSPIIFDALRNGEKYDARREIPGFAEPDFDDSGWQAAFPCNPPGGILVQEDLEPCKVMREYAPVAKRTMTPLTDIYDFGTNLTGWCKIEVEGKAGDGVEMRYSEQVRENGSLTREEIDPFVKSGVFQSDTYYLKGDGVEVFEPHFTYHGFRYVQVGRFTTVPGDTYPKVRAITAQFVHNSFTPAGDFESSDSTLNRLQQITRQSYLSNFTGIPTDCPHREKNGWTGDANIACETGLWNFDSKNAYLHFLRILTDNQRPSGQLPGIAPSAGWGYNWGSGPAWDSVLFEVVWQIYRFYGDLEPAREFYPNMAAYVNYCREMSDNYLVSFGLGDWCHWDCLNMAPTEITSTGYFYSDTVRLAELAALLGKNDDARAFHELAHLIRKSFNEKYCNGDGTYGNGVMTALAAPLYFGLAEKDQALTAEKLVQLARGRQHKADFGILGAKYVPRVLADYGYADDAFLILTQPELPGWGYWVKSGATTLWENWNGGESQNHIMFGDISAWMYQYAAGICPEAATPGFRHFTIKPCFISALNHVSAHHDTPQGRISVEWKRENGALQCTFTIPEGCTADIVLPGKELTAAAGTVTISI